MTAPVDEEYDLEASEAAIAGWVVDASRLVVGQVIWESQRGPQPPSGTYIALQVTNLREVGHPSRTYLEPDPVQSTGVDPATDRIAAAAHGVAALLPVWVDVPSGQTLAGGLAAGTTYWAIVPDADHLALASSRANAIAGTPVDVTSAGTAPPRVVPRWLIHRREQDLTATLKLECFAGDDDWSVARPTARIRRVLAGRDDHADDLRAAGVGFGRTAPVTELNLERSRIFESRALCEQPIHLRSRVDAVGYAIETVEVDGSVTPAGEDDAVALPPVVVQVDGT